jgi:hypothetical protein
VPPLDLPLRYDILGVSDAGRIALPLTIMIDGTNKTASVLVAGCQIEDRLSGRGIMRLDVIDKAANPTYRPPILKSIILSDGYTTLFGGLIQTVDEEPIVSPKRGIKSRITAYDYSAYADRVTATVTYDAARGDKSLKYIVADLRTTYLNQFGVTLDPGMLTGPNIDGEVKFQAATITECLNHVCALTGYVWYINPQKVLKCHLPTVVPTPVTLSSANSTVRTCTWGQDIGEYRNRQIVKYQGGTVTLNNTGEQTAYGVVEKVVESQEITDSTTATTLATGLLRKYDALPRVARLTTYEFGFLAGQQGTITIPERNLSGSFLIQSVVKTYVPGNHPSTQWMTEIEAVEGDEQSGAWTDAWRSMLGGSASSGGSISGGFVIPMSAVTTFNAFLGGSRLRGVQHTAVVDVPDVVDVWIDSTKFPSGVTAKVQVRTDNASTSVKPQIWEMNGQAPVGSVGEGSATTSTTWEGQSFTITLTAGLKAYRLRLVPSNNSYPVYGTGHLYV